MAELQSVIATHSRHVKAEQIDAPPAGHPCECEGDAGTDRDQQEISWLWPCVGPAGPLWLIDDDLDWLARTSTLLFDARNAFGSQTRPNVVKL